MQLALRVCQAWWQCKLQGGTAHASQQRPANKHSRICARGNLGDPHICAVGVCCLLHKPELACIPHRLVWPAQVQVGSGGVQA